MKTKKILFFTGIVLFILFLIIAFFPSLFTPYGLKDTFTVWERPSKAHILGCNDMGYDIWTEIVYGTKNTLFTGILSAVFGVVFGTLIGYIASLNGIPGRIADGIIGVFTLLPKLIVILVMAVILKGGRWTVILLISFFSWCGAAREVKAKCLHIKNMPFMDSLTVAGYNKGYIALVHTIPNLRDVLTTRLLLSLSSAIMMESSLSFLGLGDTYYPSWGTMMNFAWKRGAFLNGCYSYMLAPGFMIVLFVLAVYFVSFYLEARRDYVKEVHQNV